MEGRSWLTLLLATMLVVACGPSKTTSSDVATAARQTRHSGYPTTDNHLTGLSCPSMTDCIAVGHVARAFFDGGPETRTLIEQNTGAGWRIVPSPNDDTYVGGALRGITCIDARHCLAVGESNTEASIPKTLIEQNTGSGWAIVPSPDLSARGGNGSLAGAACATQTHCVAVGSSSFEGINVRTLVEEDVGHGWQIVPSPDPSPGGDDRLNGVACPSPHFCVAVGSHHSGDHDQPLVEQNSGSGWTIVAVPGSGGLEGVSCPSAAVCVATGGEESVSGTTLTVGYLIDEWRNGVWAAVSLAGLAGTLNGVACSSPAYCLAVSSWGTKAGGGSPVIAERINNDWEVGPPSHVDSEIGDLRGVACPSADRCIAAGDQILGNEADYERPWATFIAKHDSQGWMVQPTPNV